MGNIGKLGAPSVHCWRPKVPPTSWVEAVKDMASSDCVVTFYRFRMMGNMDSRTAGLCSVC